MRTRGEKRLAACAHLLERDLRVPVVFAISTRVGLVELPSARRGDRLRDGKGPSGDVADVGEVPVHEPSMGKPVSAPTSDSFLPFSSSFPPPITMARGCDGVEGALTVVLRPGLCIGGRCMTTLFFPPWQSRFRGHVCRAAAAQQQQTPKTL